MLTRKEFCKCCLGMVLVGIGAPQMFGFEEDKEKNSKGKRMIAYCGLACSDCKAYIATQKNDDALRAETAKEWSERFKIQVKPTDINCDGCPTDSGRLVAYCAMCNIRKCAREKKLTSCAECPEYSCAKLDKFLANSPQARKTLESMRKPG